MLKKFTTFLLMILMLNLTMLSSVSAQTNAAETAGLRNTKDKVAKIFAGKRAKVTVKYNNGTKAKGFITKVSDDDFSLSDAKTGNAVAVPYADVKSVSKNSLSSGAKIAIISGAIAGGVILFVAIGLAKSLD